MVAVCWHSGEQIGDKSLLVPQTPEASLRWRGEGTSACLDFVAERSDSILANMVSQKLEATNPEEAFRWVYADAVFTQA